MQGDPCSRSKVCEALDREIGKPRENRGQIVSHRYFQPATAFRWRSSVLKLKPRLSQNSLRRTPLLTNSATNC